MSQQPEEFKILIIGESGVGKTSISKRFKDDEFKTHTRETTVATVWKKEVEVEGREVALVIYDTGGHPTFRSLIVANYFREADGVVLVYDVGSSLTFHKLADWLKQVTDLNPSAALLVVGNKSDEESKKKVYKESVDGFLQENHLEWMETSAKSGHNVQQVFEKLTLKILVNKQLAATQGDPPSTQQELPAHLPPAPKEDLSEEAPTDKECEDGAHEDPPPTPSSRRNSAPPSLPYALYSEEDSFIFVEHLPPILSLPSDQVSELSINRFRKMSSDSVSSLVYHNEQFQDIIRQHREAAQKSKQKCCIL